ncbi:hypothetical protein [Clostridioides difficile]|nr:hypothetical protein [Clostridioides difficile]EQG62412.1 hypothetical protein QK3_0190 [Clostridioides difficile DA00145]EQI03103.1 hypothetical protein QO7_0183 [Clostridioides difficile F314]EQK11216.1 hypothetical protein QUI_0182 [Clostridioides difficile P59]MCR1369610.1 hypothetical protein [Clostridioides difficile]MCR1379915.1 hypothetical protein [Clostridioides difficile]
MRTFAVGLKNYNIGNISDCIYSKKVEILEVNGQYENCLADFGFE